MKHYFDVALGPKGPVAQALVTVWNGGTNQTVKATIFSDNGITAKPNPFATDALGNFDFYVADGGYDITFAAGNVQFRLQTDVQIGTTSLPAGTGTGLLVFQNSPTLITPNIGAATGTSLDLGTIASQSLAALRVRTNITTLGNQVEFGHINTAGYGSNLGDETGSGLPFIAFMGEAGTTANTYRSRGNTTRIIRSSTAGLLSFDHLANANADNQTPTNDATLDTSGVLSVVGAFRAADGSAAAPSLSFINNTNTGLYKLSGFPVPIVSAGGTTLTMFTDAANVPGVRFGSGASIQFSSNANPTLAVSDTGLSRPAAATVAIGNGTQGDFSGTILAGNAGIGASPNYPVDINKAISAVTLNLKANVAAAGGNYGEIAFQTWSGAGSGANTFGGAGTSRPSVVLRGLSESGSAAGSFVVATFAGGADNTTLTEKFRVPSTGGIQLSGTTSGVITITPQAAAGTYTLPLPTAKGTANQVLAMDGAGTNLTFTSITGTGATISGNVNSLGLVAAVGTTTIQAGVAGHLYAVHAYLNITAAGAGGGSTSVTIGWTDSTGARTSQSTAIVNTGTGFVNFDVPIFSAGAANITYATTTGAGPPTYDLHIRVLDLGA